MTWKPLKPGKARAGMAVQIIHSGQMGVIVRAIDASTVEVETGMFNPKRDYLRRQRGARAFGVQESSMTDQLERVREHGRCVLCRRAKPKGLLLCWPCHGAEKRRSRTGRYSAATLRKLAALERRLARRGRRR